MVFAIRRLLLRSRIPNPTLRLSTQLNLNWRHTVAPSSSVQLLRTPSCLQQRQFSVQTRLQKDEKDNDKVGVKELESKSEEASKSEDVEPLKNEEHVELPVKDEAIAEPPTSLPTGDDPIVTKEETAVFEHVELPTKDESVSEPPTNLPTNEDPIETNEEAAVFEHVELPTKEAISEPSTIPEVLSKEEPSQSATVEPTQSTTVDPSRKGVVVTNVAKKYFNEQDGEEDFDMTPEELEKMQAWQKTIGLADEQLAYFIDTYPGIDAPLIEAVHTGKLPEEAVLDILEEQLAEEEKEMSPDIQEKLKRMSKHFEDMDPDTFAEDPNFSPLELRQLGLRQSDIDALKDDTANLTPAQTFRIGQALRKAGLAKEEFDDILDMEEGLKEEEEYSKKMGLDHLPEPELPERPVIDVYTKVMEDIEAMQARTGISEDRVMHWISKFQGQVTADLIEAGERNRVTEDRLEYYIEKYAGTYPFPADSSLILAMDKGEIEEEAFAHVVNSIPSPPPEIVKAVLNGERTVEEVNELREKYNVPTHVIGSVYKKDITEEQLSKFINEYPGVEPDVRLINDVEQGLYDQEHLTNLKLFGELYPNIMNAEYWRGVLAGEYSQEDLDKAENAAEDDPWDIPVDALQAWQDEYGISDRMLDFLREAYPGIWPDLITSFAIGEIKESEIPKLIDSNEPWQMPKGMIDRWLKDQEIPEARMIELRKKFPKIWPNLLADVVQGEVEEADVERIIAEDEAEQAENATPWSEAGITEKNIAKWQEKNGVSDEMLQYLTDTYPDITPDIVADFAEGLIEQKEIPAAIKRYQQQRGMEVEDEENEVEKEAKELEIPSQVEGKTMAEKIDWYQNRYPGIDMETITMAEMGVITEAQIPDIMRDVPTMNNDQEYMMSELLKMPSEELKKAGQKFMDMLAVEKGWEPGSEEEVETPMEKAMKIKDGPLTKLLPINGGKIEDLAALGPDEWYQMLLAEGIDPNKMSEKEIFKLMDEKFSMKDWEHTDEDGHSIRYFTPKTKEELAKIEAGLGNPLEPMVFDPPGMGEQEWANELLQEETSAQEEAEIEKGLDEMFGALSKDEIEEAKKERVEEGFFNYGEENPKEVGEDEEFQGDDISSQGHEELEQHRELREYARLAAWELPLLHKLAKPFEPPKKNQPLRFRYTTYFGAQHPADKKVVVEFAPNDMLDLTDIQRMKMIKLAGVRYNPSTGLIKMASESMETQAQNKRYLGDIVTKLIKESKDPKDTFEDVPVDFRHHTPKPFHKLPERWKLTSERKRQLEEKRRQALEDERAKIDTGKLVDGVGVIEQAMKRLGMAQLQEKKNAMGGAKVAVPVARRGVVGKGKVGQGPLGGRK